MKFLSIDKEIIYSTNVGVVHNILNWVNKDDPRGAYPTNPSNDPQFERWERGVRIWAQSNGYSNDQPYMVNQ